MSKNAPDFKDTVKLIENEIENDELESAKKRLDQKRMKENSGGSSNESNTSNQNVLVQKKHDANRKPLTLKVQLSNEQQFHKLYFQLQLRGDSRKKQELADEALELLFTKYRTILDRE